MRFTIAIGLLASAAFVQSTSIEYLGDTTTNCPIAANELVRPRHFSSPTHILDGDPF